MQTIELLNIPNYFCSFYIKALNNIARIEYKQEIEFEKWNGQPLIIFRVLNKLIVIDNRDPVGVPQDLYDLADIFFVTNQLKGSSVYNQNKIRPLFPHYPIDTWNLYLKIFGQDWFSKIGWKNTLREISIHIRRPLYKNYNPSYSFSPYIFFSGSIWKKEAVANAQRSSFIKACKNNPEINFEGGLVPRGDGDNLGLNQVIGPKRYTSKEFHKKSFHSLINFYNPAVLGAISWRFAEYLNMGTFILSMPWKTELPVSPIHGKEIHMIEDVKEIDDFLNFILKNQTYHKMISEGGKAYFNKYCSPTKQAEMVLSEIMHN